MHTHWSHHVLMTLRNSVRSTSSCCKGAEICCMLYTCTSLRFKPTLWAIPGSFWCTASQVTRKMWVGSKSSMVFPNPFRRWFRTRALLSPNLFSLLESISIKKMAPPFFSTFISPQNPAIKAGVGVSRPVGKGSCLGNASGNASRKDTTPFSLICT